LASGHEPKWLAPGVRYGFFDDFVVEFDDGLAQYVEYGGAARGEVIVPTATFSIANGGLRSQPAVALQTFQEGVERARADVVAVAAQLSQDPLTDDGMLGGMMENVDLPEA
jgi:hypothetical protein